MALRYDDLDEATRKLMLEEIDMDIHDGTLHLSNMLSAPGREAWPGLLREAAQTGSDQTLAAALCKGGCAEEQVGDATAGEAVCEAEFNRYYARGLCRRAIDASLPELEVYHAREGCAASPEAQQVIGRRVKPEATLLDLTAKGVEPTLGLPAEPSSGLSLRIPR